MPHTQWRPPHISLLRDPSELLRLYGDHASEDPMKSSSLNLGLPAPIWPSKQELTPSERSQRAAQRQGIQVHAVIGRIAEKAQGASLDELDKLVTEALTEVVVGRENGNLRRARTRVSGLIHQYVRIFLPPPGVEFHGSEVPITGGRADLLWWHPSQGWFFDEVKTFRFGTDDDFEYRSQVIKYLAAGRALSGEFAGVRLIALGNTKACRLYTPDGLTGPLTDSVLAPDSIESTLANPRSEGMA